MRQRPLNHERDSLAAINDVISRPFRALGHLVTGGPGLPGDQGDSPAESLRGRVPELNDLDSPLARRRRRHPAHGGRWSRKGLAGGWLSTVGDDVVAVLEVRGEHALVAAQVVTPAEKQWAELMRREVRGRLRHLLVPDAVLCLPTTPFPAPPTGLPLSRQNEIGLQITTLTCVAGLSGLPQLSVPGATVEGRPVGLSFIGPAGSEARLIALARAIEDP